MLSVVFIHYFATSIFLFVCWFFFFFKFQKGFIKWGWGGGSVLLVCHFPHGGEDITQLLSLALGMDVCLHSFLDELEGMLVLGELEQLRGSPFTGSEASHLTDHVRMNLVCLVRHPWRWQCPSLLTFLVTLCLLLRPPAMG